MSGVVGSGWLAVCFSEADLSRVRVAVVVSDEEKRRNMIEALQSTYRRGDDGVNRTVRSS